MICQRPLDTIFAQLSFKNLKIIPIFDCFLEDHKFISNEKIIISLPVICRDNFVCNNIEVNLGKREFDYPVNRTTSLKKKCQSVVDCVALRVIALNDTRGEEREVGKVRFVVRDGVKHSLERRRVAYNVVSLELNVSREPSYPLSRHYVIKPYPVCEFSRQKRAMAFANSPSLSKK